MWGGGGGGGTLNTYKRELVFELVSMALLVANKNYLETFYFPSVGLRDG